MVERCHVHMITWRPEGKHKSIISSSSQRFSLKIARSRPGGAFNASTFFLVETHPSLSNDGSASFSVVDQEIVACLAGFYRVDVMKEANEAKMNLDITR